MELLRDLCPLLLVPCWRSDATIAYSIEVAPDQFIDQKRLPHAAGSQSPRRHWLRLEPWKTPLFYHPCFAKRLGGVLGGKETQGWRASSHTAMVGAGKFGSAKLPMATATYPGKPSPSQ